MAKLIGKHKPVYIVNIGCTHGGEKNSLANPETHQIDTSENTETKVPYTMTPFNWKMWGYYTEHINSVKEIAGNNDIIVTHNGDSVQGLRHLSQASAHTERNQRRIAYYNMMPWTNMKNVKAIYMTAGTETHDGINSTAPFQICDMINKRWDKKAQKRKVTAHASYHLYLSVGDFKIDIAHKGLSVSKRKHTEGNTQRAWTKSMMNTMLLDNEQPPDVFLRGHFHDYYSEKVSMRYKGNMHYSWHIQNPSYSGIGLYGRQATTHIHKISWGMSVLEIVNGRMTDDPIWFIEQADLRERVVYKKT